VNGNQQRLVANGGVFAKIAGIILNGPLITYSSQQSIQTLFARKFMEVHESFPKGYQYCAEYEEYNTYMKEIQ
jgi:hypothetical protein